MVLAIQHGAKPEMASLFSVHTTRPNWTTLMRLFYWLANIFEWLLRGKNTRELAEWLRTPRNELFAIVPAYDEFTIPKKSGGVRRIQAPNSELKTIQRRILRRLLAGLKSHSAAVGFEQGKSIVTGARQHTGKAIVLRFDIVDFFPSTSKTRIYNYFRNIGWNRRAAKLLCRLVTHESCLPQGAPTSPRLSNLINYLMDHCIEEFVGQFDGTYTRYADDITVSFPDPDCDLEEIIDGVFRYIRWNGYRPHLGKKLKVSRRSQRQSVNGLVVNERVNLPRERRRWLRSVKHRAKANWNTHGTTDPDNASHASQPEPSISPAELQGWIALEKMIQDQR